MNKVKVELGAESYPIFVGMGILNKLGEMLQIYQTVGDVAIITDPQVYELYKDRLADSLAEHVNSFEFIQIPAGDKAKTLSSAEDTITAMLKFGYDRTVTVLAFGGGVIGDIAGFVASIYKRGVPFVQIPTTLLAQVDASVGGKTGVNHALGKNLIGTFYQPKLVWCDLELLDTLPKREVLCGLGEIIKYGIIKDAGLFEHLEEKLDRIVELEPKLLEGIVHKSCQIKSDVVSKDERESGLRMILNFGHTVGHAIEAAGSYDAFSHGEAVLVGMLAESKIALDSGLLAREDFGRIKSLITRTHIEIPCASLDIDRVLGAMKMDKKAVAGRLRFVLPKRIGEVIIADDVESSKIKNSLSYIRGIS